MERFQTRTVAMNPSRLTRFMDGAAGSAQSSFLGRAQTASSPMYDPSMSWDGLSVDPRPFSRLDAKPQTQNAALRPTGLAGTRVLEREDNPVRAPCAAVRA